MQEILLPPSSKSDPVVRSLEEALARAKSGRTVGIGLVEVFGPENMAINAAGGLPAAISVGATHLADITRQALFQKRSVILPARMA